MGTRGRFWTSSLSAYCTRHVVSVGFGPAHRVVREQTEAVWGRTSERGHMSLSVLNRLKEWSKVLKRDVIAVYLAARDPRVPWYVKALALCVAGYALSPIDLIPDFIPVFGYLDDLIIVPLGIIAVVKLIPPKVMAEHRVAAAKISEKPVS